MNTFLFLRYGIRMLYFFSYLVRVQILKTEYKYGQILLLSDNQIVDIFRVSDNWYYLVISGIIC